MPIITSVEPQKKNPKRFNVFLDGQFAFGADEDLIVNFRLIKGKEIESQDIEKLLFESEVGKLMERMYNLFSIRQRSEKEVRDYLKNKSFKQVQKDKEPISDVVIDEAIRVFKDRGLINDLEFAKAWIESRRLSKQKGPQVLKAELYQKGIDREIVEETVGSLEMEVGDEELAEQALEKKFKAFKNLEKPEFKKKASEFLLRRGFEYGVVRDVVAKFMAKL